jgi:hypothetical protein
MRAFTIRNTDSLKLVLSPKGSSGKMHMNAPFLGSKLVTDVLGGKTIHFAHMLMKSTLTIDTPGPKPSADSSDGFPDVLPRHVPQLNGGLIRGKDIEMFIHGVTRLIKLLHEKSHRSMHVRVTVIIRIFSSLRYLDFPNNTFHQGVHPSMLSYNSPKPRRTQVQDISLGIQVISTFAMKKHEVDAPFGRGRPNGTRDRTTQALQRTLIDMYRFNTVKSHRQDVSLHNFLLSLT